MPQQGVNSLEILASIAISKYNIVTDKLPISFQKRLKHMHFLNFSEIPSKAAKLVLQNFSQKYMCIVSGGYASYQCMFTQEHGDIDVFILVPPDEIERLFQKVTNVLEQTCISGFFSVFPIYAYDKNKKVIRVWDKKLSEKVTGHGCDIIFLAVEEPNKDVMTNVYSACTYLVSDFDLDICKCVGVMVHNYTAGCEKYDMLFFPMCHSNEFVKDQHYEQTVIHKPYIYDQKGPRSGMSYEIKKFKDLKFCKNILKLLDGNNGKLYDHLYLAWKTLDRWHKYNERVSNNLRTLSQTKNDAESIDITNNVLHRWSVTRQIK